MVVLSLLPSFLFCLSLLSLLLLPSSLSVLERQKPFGAGIPCPKFPTFCLEVGTEKTTLVDKFASPIAGLCSGSLTLLEKVISLTSLTSVHCACPVAEGTQVGHFPL